MIYAHESFRNVTTFFTNNETTQKIDKGVKK